MKKSISYTALLSLAAATGFIAILAITTLPPPNPERPVPGIGARFEYATAERRLSAIEIDEKTVPWRALDSPVLTVHGQFAYVMVTVANDSPEGRSLIIHNRTRNYFTALLLPTDRGAEIKYKQGDPVPAGQSPLRHTRAAFPVQVASGETKTFFLEYMNERDIVIDPAVSDSSDWFSRAGLERDIATLVASSMFGIVLVNLVAGLLLGRLELLRVAFLMFSLLLFFLRQSRLFLLLIDPLAYAAWFYPFCIGLELVSAHIFFGFLMGPNFRPWQHLSYRLLTALTVAIVGVSFFFEPFTMADILNLFALITLMIVLIGVYHALRSRDAHVLQTMLAFAPWIGLMASEVILNYISPRQIFLADFRQAFGMILSFILVTATSMHGSETEGSDELARVVTERDAALRNVERCLAEMGENRARERARIASECLLPLDGIVASAAALGREHTDPGVVSASRMIAEEASSVRRLLSESEGDAE